MASMNACIESCKFTMSIERNHHISKCKYFVALKPEMKTRKKKRIFPALFTRCTLKHVSERKKKN